MTEPATFRAAFPSIQSAIRFSGDGNGARIQLDIPEEELPTAIRLLAWRERVLVVTIRPEMRLVGTNERDNETETRASVTEWPAGTALGMAGGGLRHPPNSPLDD